MLSRVRVIDSTGCAQRISKLIPHTITHHKDIHSEKSKCFRHATLLPMKIKKLQTLHFTDKNNTTQKTNLISQKVVLLSLTKIMTKYRR